MMSEESRKVVAQERDDQAEGNEILHYQPDREGNLNQQLKDRIAEIFDSIIKQVEAEKQAEVEKQAEAEKSKRREELKEKIQRIGDPLKEIQISSVSIEQSRKQIIENALATVCVTLKAQSAAIFLISKRGRLERIAIYGYDKSGERLKDDSWLPEEAYDLGESFTGQAAVVPPGEQYGSIQYTEQLELIPEFRDAYLEKFGSLKSAIAIPLNGRNKTYGVLRVINKVHENSDNTVTLSNQSFSNDDFKELLFLATNIANTLSNFRRDKQAEILTFLAQLVVQSPTYWSSTKKLYQEILDLLVKNPDTAFSAGILRVHKAYANQLMVETVSYATGVTQDRDDSPRTFQDDGFLWMVAENRKRLILHNIQRPDRLSLFKNQGWIRKNEFQSYACFPLVADGILLGTLSLYAGYRYEVHPDSISFLQGVANLIARLMLNFKRYTHPYLKIDQSLEERFNLLVETWKKETSGLSSITKKMRHSAYQEIIALGSDAIPLLLRELKQCPNHWFLALSEITGENPVLPDQWGHVQEMAKVWVEWGKNQGYVFDF